MKYNGNKSENRKKTIEKEGKENCEDFEIKTMMKEINKYYRYIFKINKVKKKINPINSSLTITNDRLLTQRKELRKSNSLTNQLTHKIVKEALIIELRRELKYQMKFKYIYNNYLSKLIQLREEVKDNKEKIENKTNLLKETFNDKFVIITQFQKSIDILEKQRNEIITSSKEVINMKDKIRQNLLDKLNKIQFENNKQSTKIDELNNKIGGLELKKIKEMQKLEEEFHQEEENYKKILGSFDSLKRKYIFFTEEYNSYIKTGQEIAQQDVKLFDKTNATNCLEEENLTIKLKESKMKEVQLKEKLDILKSKVAILQKMKKQVINEDERKQNFEKLLRSSIKKNLKQNVRARKFRNSRLSNSASFGGLINKYSFIN